MPKGEHLRQLVLDARSPDAPTRIPGWAEWARQPDIRRRATQVELPVNWQLKPGEAQSLARWLSNVRRVLVNGHPKMDLRGHMFHHWMPWGAFTALATWGVSEYDEDTLLRALVTAQYVPVEDAEVPPATPHMHPLLQMFWEKEGDQVFYYARLHPCLTHPLTPLGADGTLHQGAEYRQYRTGR